MTSDSKLNIQERAVGDVIVLALSGEFTVDDGDLVFRRRIHDLVERGCPKVVVDLAGVTYIDSSGVGMLAAKLKTVREKGGDIRLARMTPRSQRLFGMLKLLIAFQTYDDEAEAIRSFEWP
jgi:anti-sigma B factor antagonist